MGNNRFSLYFENHVGFGVRWRSWIYPLEISISVPFVTVFVGIGAERPQ
jgi:outer membrane translocation and assembly module TamA